eukprot:TRINITY_DN63721_c0_g1_i1.p1 TRINITY_DN63721_c0_g1~~TRINITY_DN63721_c0_g1_i1.p1  ORF type:complete len:508 (+),score=44.97 TRINITY_DN63721_c0_g1_i1:42-1526(+)
MGVDVQTNDTIVVAKTEIRPKIKLPDTPQCSALVVARPYPRPKISLQVTPQCSPYRARTLEYRQRVEKARAEGKDGFADSQPNQAIVVSAANGDCEKLNFAGSVDSSSVKALCDSTAGTAVEGAKGDELDEAMKQFQSELKSLPESTGEDSSACVQPAVEYSLEGLQRQFEDAATHAFDSYDVPRFLDEAKGTPMHWNSTKPLIWGRRVKNMQCFAEHGTSRLFESVHRLEHFLRLRLDADGVPIRDKLGKADFEPHSFGWFRYPWLPYEAAGGDGALPETSPGPYGGGLSDWKRAWHGCKMEGLYSIMYHGRLLGSRDAERGDRFFERAPGVYVHKDATCHKTGNYFRFVPLFQDGVFWAALWEVMVDRSDRVAVSGTDQWVQQERSVRLRNLWLVGCDYQHMQNGWEVTEKWDPLLEANPKSIKVTDALEVPAQEQQEHTEVCSTGASKESIQKDVNESQEHRESCGCPLHGKKAKSQCKLCGKVELSATGV